MKQSFLNKSQIIQLRTFNPIKNIPGVLQTSPIKIWGKSFMGLLLGGTQKSSTSNHRHPNVLCGKRAPQLLIFLQSYYKETNRDYYFINNDELKKYTVKRKKVKDKKRYSTLQYSTVQYSTVQYSSNRVNSVILNPWLIAGC